MEPPSHASFLTDDALGVDDEQERMIDSCHETTFSQHIKPPTETKNQAAFHVLVVEDNPIAQTVTQSILSRMNCSVDLAETGKTALDLWKSNHYDLILMDIGLPDMDGYEVNHQKVTNVVDIWKKGNK